MQQYPNYPPYQPTPEPPKRRSWLMGRLIFLTLLVFSCLAFTLGAVWYLKPPLSEQAGGVLANELEQQIERKLQEQLGGATGDIPAGFVGEVVIPEGEVNQFIQANPQQIAPLDSATVRFQPGILVADVTAYGFSGTASAGVQIGADGRVQVVNAHVDGALGYVLDGAQIGRTLETQLNNQLAANRQRISAIEIQQGQIVATVESIQ